MNRFWLKISGIAAAALVLVTVIAINFFGSAKTRPIIETKQIAESKDTRHLQQEDRPDLQAQPKMPHYDRDMSRRYPDIALRKPPELGQKQHHFTDEEIGVQSPDSLQSEKAAHLLRNTPRCHVITAVTG